LGATTLGQVARDLAKADQPAVRRAQRGDDDVGPEPGAVLADAPAVVLEPAVLAGQSQFGAGPVALVGLVGIEDGEMFAQDLIGGVAVDRLPAAGPGDDVAAGVEHEDGVVADALDEEPELLLPAMQAVSDLTAVVAVV